MTACRNLLLRDWSCGERDSIVSTSCSHAANQPLAVSQYHMLLWESIHDRRRPNSLLRLCQRLSPARRWTVLPHFHQSILWLDKEGMKIDSNAKREKSSLIVVRTTIVLWLLWRSCNCERFAARQRNSPHCAAFGLRPVPRVSLLACLLACLIACLSVEQ